MQPRYFIGITLSRALSRTIAQAQDKLITRNTKLVMEPLVPHITLLHPDLLMTLPPSHFIPKIKQVADTQLPLTISLEKPAMFDQRVLHISVHSPALIELQKNLVTLLPDQIRAQYEVGRQYTPHVTLLQAKPMQKLPLELIDEFKTRFEPLFPQSFTAYHLAQFHWLRPRSYMVEPF